MSEVRVDDVRVLYRTKSGTHGVRTVSFEVRKGEMLVLLGPSGCGKTTTLRAVAGLEKPQRGRIEVGGRCVFDAAEGRDVPTHKRDVGVVFQSFALWPHMSAEDNISYPLKVRRVSRKERAERVVEMSTIVDLDPSLLGKRPGQLSGGQQQRVALARALAGQTGVVLFDEPLSNLDARLREQLRAELRALHQRLGFTGIYVTHDLSEALAVGDTVAVMNDGEILQYGSVRDVYENPAEEAVARVVGFHRLGTVGDLEGPRPTSVQDAPADHSVFARQVNLSVARDQRPVDADTAVMRGEVLAVDDFGKQSQVTVALPAGPLRIWEDTVFARTIMRGELVSVEIPLGTAQVYPGTATDRDRLPDAAEPPGGDAPRHETITSTPPIGVKG